MLLLESTHPTPSTIPGDALSVDSCVEVFSWMFKRLVGFLPMEHNITLCADIVMVMETLIKTATSLSAIIVQVEGGGDDDDANVVGLAALSGQLSTLARDLLQRHEVGGLDACRVPGRVVGFLVTTHLEHASDRQLCLESWATEVLPLMCGDEDDQEEAVVHFPTLTRSNFAHYFGPLLAVLCKEFKESHLDGVYGRDHLALLIKVGYIFLHKNLHFVSVL
jgi:hypothetical protein